jgi:Lysylphosphatidylglycerol synthase TM region
MPGEMAILGSRRARIVFNVVSAAVAAAVGVLTARHFVTTGWPLGHAKVFGVVAAGALFLGAYATKAVGWALLFRAEKRPRAIALAAAGGAASVTGLALPGRCDDVVRIAVVRRYPGYRACIGSVCLSLFLLALVETAAMAPFASVAAGVAAPSMWLRAGLLVIAAAGVLSAIVVLALPRLLHLPQISRFRVVRWAHEHTTTPRDAVKAWFFVMLSWSLRGIGLLILLDALALHVSIPLALGFLCASAAAAALPIAPGGAVAQLGAGAAMLAAGGMHASEAVAFSVAAQGLVVVVGALVVAMAAAAPILARLR